MYARFYDSGGLFYPFWGRLALFFHTYVFLSDLEFGASDYRPKAGKLGLFFK